MRCLFLYSVATLLALFPCSIGFGQPNACDSNYVRNSGAQGYQVFDVGELVDPVSLEYWNTAKTTDQNDHEDRVPTHDQFDFGPTPLPAVLANRASADSSTLGDPGKDGYGEMAVSAWANVLPPGYKLAVGDSELLARWTAKTLQTQNTVYLGLCEARAMDAATTGGRMQIVVDPLEIRLRDKSNVEVLAPLVSSTLELTSVSNELRARMNLTEDGEGLVDGDDLQFLQDNFGAEGEGLSADINSDGVVDFLDFLSFREIVTTEPNTGHDVRAIWTYEEGAVKVEFQNAMNKKGSWDLKLGNDQFPILTSGSSGVSLPASSLTIDFDGVEPWPDNSVGFGYRIAKTGIFALAKSEIKLAEKDNGYLLDLTGVLKENDLLNSSRPVSAKLDWGLKLVYDTSLALSNYDAVGGVISIHATDKTMPFIGGFVCDPDSMGDANGDGVVSFPDFLILSGNFGESAESHEEGDFNCDGEVNFSDFLILSANFGLAPPAKVANTPEPSVNYLAIIALCSFCGRRTRGRKVRNDVA